MKSPQVFLAIALFVCAGTLCEASDGAPLPGLGTQEPREGALKGYIIDLANTKVDSHAQNTEATMRGNESKKRAPQPVDRKEALRVAIGKLNNTWQILNVEKGHPTSKDVKSELYTTSIYISSRTISHPDYKQSLHINTINRDAYDKPTKDGVYESPISSRGKSSPDWLCYYEGEFGVPEDGEYRFVGNVNEGVMLVGVDKKTVFYAFKPKQKFGYALKKCGKDWEPEGYCGEEGNDGAKVTDKDLYKGSWLPLTRGKPYHIQIAFGSDMPLSEVKLGVQRRIPREEPDTDDNFPLFTLEKVRTYSKEAEEREIELKTPIPTSDPDRKEKQDLAKEELKNMDMDTLRKDSLFEIGPYNSSCVFKVRKPKPPKKHSQPKKKTPDQKS